MYGRKNISNDDDDKQQQRRPPASSAVSSTTASNNIGMYDAYNRSAAFSNNSSGGGFNDSFRSPTPISIHDTFIGSEERVIGGGLSSGRGSSDSSSLSRSDYDSGGNEAGEEASGE